MKIYNLNTHRYAKEVLRVEVAISEALPKEKIAFHFSDDSSIISDDLPIVIEVSPIVGVLRSSAHLAQNVAMDNIHKAVKALGIGTGEVVVGLNSWQTFSQG
ncbi:MAG: hypothetical protein NTZ42_03845 [Candidatus Gribaldobacteria bacterium]|nr:hypothetical protein [Candidatus Gribaldobacteria bacterium]